MRQGGGRYSGGRKEVRGEGGMRILRTNINIYNIFPPQIFYDNKIKRAANSKGTG